MAILSPETAISIQAVKHQKPGKYIQNIFGNPSLNPFLVRVRSRDYHLAPNQIHRQTAVWVHESIFPGPFFLPPTRRYQTENENILEQVYIYATDHHGLQTRPRRFEKTTQLLQQVI